MLAYPVGSRRTGECRPGERSRRPSPEPYARRRCMSRDRRCSRRLLGHRPLVGQILFVRRFRPVGSGDRRRDDTQAVPAQTWFEDRLLMRPCSPVTASRMAPPTSPATTAGAVGPIEAGPGKHTCPKPSSGRRPLSLSAQGVCRGGDIPEPTQKSILSLRRRPEAALFTEMRSRTVKQTKVTRTNRRQQSPGHFWPRRRLP